MADPTDRAASAPVWRREEVESPCVQVCVVHPGARLCVGCLRTPDEIARWSSYTPETRREIMDALPTRADRLRAPEARPSRRRDAARRRAAAESDPSATGTSDARSENDPIDKG